jgi:hypothetical protein
LRAQFSLICAFYFPFLPAEALARRPCSSPPALSAFSPASSTLAAEMARNLPSLSSSSGHYVGVWAPLVGGHVRADGRDSLLLVLHAPACLVRLDVRLLARLTRSLENSRMSSDHRPTNSPIMSISSTASLYALSTQARKPWVYSLFSSLVFLVSSLLTC